MPKLPECDRCQLCAHDPHLVCAIHPEGVTGDRCLDFAIDPTLSDLEDLQQWEPVGASYYNGELILQPQQRFDLEEKLMMLDWHPLFTGRCPNCDRPIHQTEPLRVHWDCQACGWKDDLV